jgi:hypothetical protein
MSDPVRDELHKECEEIKKIVYEILYDFRDEKTTPEQLIRDFGLTANEAKTWLENEPDFHSIRRIFTGDESDEDLTEPKYLVFGYCFVWTTST